MTWPCYSLAQTTPVSNIFSWFQKCLSHWSSAVYLFTITAEHKDGNNVLSSTNMSPLVFFNGNINMSLQFFSVVVLKGENNGLMKHFYFPFFLLLLTGNRGNDNPKWFTSQYNTIRKYVHDPPCNVSINTMINKYQMTLFRPGTCFEDLCKQCRPSSDAAKCSI